MTEKPKPSLTIADAAERISERTGDEISNEWVRRQIKSGRLYAERAGGTATAPWMLYQGDVARFAEREAHKRRTRGVVVAYRDEEFDANMEQTHGAEGLEQIRKLRERHEDLREAQRAVSSDPDLRRAFEQLDEDERIERTAQEIAARVRREERIRKRAAQILAADDDEHHA